MNSLFSRYPSILILLLGLAAWCGALMPSPITEEETYDYLAIGNSITRHPVCEYWWNDIGMAASEENKDYFHIVTAHLQEKHGRVNARAVNYVQWETAGSKERKKTFELIDPYLTEELELITLQLSENAASSASLGRDYQRLILHLQEKCPQARIVLVDDFWSDDKSKVKKETAEKLELPFADLSGIRNDPAYQWTVGDIVYGSDGQPHAIDNDNVARHPNDLGMEYIAGQIIRQLDALP